MPPTASRPGMPASYGIDTGEDGLLHWGWAEERLARARNYWLATAGADGRPHSAPVWGVWHDGAFWFGTDAASRKGRNLAVRPRAVVHLESGDEAVIAEGEVCVESNPEVVSRIVAEYRDKYGLGEDFDLESCLVLRPDSVLGWLEHDFPTSATRWTP